jgi:predicted secreted protein
MKRLLLFVSILVLFASANLTAGCGINTKMFSESATNINVRVNEKFGIVLDTNLTTGYNWNQSNDSTMIELIDRTYRKGEHAKSTGGSGVEYFTFKALKAGETKIIMTYERPWEKEIIKEVVFTVIIQ